MLTFGGGVSGEARPLFGTGTETCVSPCNSAVDCSDLRAVDTLGGGVRLSGLKVSKAVGRRDAVFTMNSKGLGGVDTSDSGVGVGGPLSSSCGILVVSSPSWMLSIANCRF